MARYIDADKFKEILNSNDVVHKMKAEEFNFEQGYLSGLIEAQIKLADMSTADVESVQYGKWVSVESYDPREHISRCSCCGEAEAWTTKYCPNCGAKMDKED